MANNKVVLSDGTVLMDISSDTVTVDTLLSGYTAHDCHGNQITGAATSGGSTSDATATASDIAKSKTAYVKGAKITGTVQEISSGGYTPTGDVTNSVDGNNLRLSVDNTKDVILRSNTYTSVEAPLSDFGNATAEDVVSGRTFTSAAGVKVVGKAGSSAGSLPSEIVAGDTPIWICYPNHETSSSSSSKYSIGYDFHFVVPKNGTYRFTFVGWSIGTSGTKAGVTLSTTSNKVGTTGLTGTNSTGSTGVLLPYSNADNFATSVDVTVTDKKNVWFFANSGSGQYGGIANRGKIYAVVVSIAWDNGTSS